MNRQFAKEVASIVSNQELKQMFLNAKEEIKDWSKVSDINKSMTKGTAWNIFTRAFDETKQIHILAKINMIREFGDYLHSPLCRKRDKNNNRPTVTPIHQEPDFTLLK